MGLVFVQGAQAPTADYVPLVKAIQAASPLRLWAALPAFPLSTPEPAVIGSGMSRAIAALQAAGLPASAPVVVAAHSLGGVMLQDWTFKHSSSIAAGIKSVRRGVSTRRSKEGILSRRKALQAEAAGGGASAAPCVGSVAMPLAAEAAAAAAAKSAKAAGGGGEQQSLMREPRGPDDLLSA